MKKKKKKKNNKKAAKPLKMTTTTVSHEGKFNKEGKEEGRRDAENIQGLAKTSLPASIPVTSNLLKELTSDLRQQSIGEGLSSNADQQSALHKTLARLSLVRSQDKPPKSQLNSVAFSRSLPALLEELLLIQTNTQVEALVVRQAQTWSPETEDIGQEHFYSWFLSEKIPACAVVLAFAGALKKYPILRSHVRWLVSV